MGVAEKRRFRATLVLDPGIVELTGWRLLAS